MQSCRPASAIRAIGGPISPRMLWLFVNVICSCGWQPNNINSYHNLIIPSIAQCKGDFNRETLTTSQSILRYSYWCSKVTHACRPEMKNDVTGFRLFASFMVSD